MQCPRQVSWVLDAVLADPRWAALVDARRIAVVGHSAGGYTVLALSPLGQPLNAASLGAVTVPVMIEHSICDEVLATRARKSRQRGQAAACQATRSKPAGSKAGSRPGPPSGPVPAWKGAKWPASVCRWQRARGILGHDGS